jgi:hypothetical protein
MNTLTDTGADARQNTPNAVYIGPDDLVFDDLLTADDAAEEIDGDPPPGADIPAQLEVSGWMSKRGDQLAWWCRLCDRWHFKRWAGDEATKTRSAPQCMRRICREIVLCSLGRPTPEMSRRIAAGKAPDGSAAAEWIETSAEFRRLFIEEQKCLLEWSQDRRPDGQVEHGLRDLLRLCRAYRAMSRDGLDRVRRYDLSMALSHMLWSRMSAVEAVEAIRSERERAFLAALRPH